MNVLPAGVYVSHTHAWYVRRSEEGPVSLELELWSIVHSHVGAGNQSQDLCKSRVLLAAELPARPLFSEN